MNVICLRLLLSTFNRGEQIHRLFLASVFVEYYLSALHCLQVCSVSLFPAPGVSGRCEEGGGRRGGISARWRSCSEMADYSHCLLRPGETRIISDISSLDHVWLLWSCLTQILSMLTLIRSLLGPLDMCRTRGPLFTWWSHWQWEWDWAQLSVVVSAGRVTRHNSLWCPLAPATLLY